MFHDARFFSGSVCIPTKNGVSCGGEYAWAIHMYSLDANEATCICNTEPTCTQAWGLGMGKQVLFQVAAAMDKIDKI